MSNIDNIIRKFEPIDSNNKVDSLISAIKQQGIEIDNIVELKIKFKIADAKVLGYYLSKYIGTTPGNIGVRSKNRFPKINKHKKVYYGCDAQEEYIKKKRKDRNKRLSETDDEWRKVKHKLPIVEFEGEVGVRYGGRAHIIYTPMGNKR